jgi:hypothetical protein
VNRQHINLLAYLAFTAFTIMVVVGYQQHNNSRFDAADRISCANRQILIANQRVVLNVLERNVTQFIRIATAEDDRTYFERSLTLLHQARASINATPVCLARDEPSHKTPHP